MNAPSAARIEQVFEEMRMSVAVRTDRMFAMLFVFQWALAVVLAILLSPRQWSGASSVIHPYVLSSFFLSGVLALMPLVLILRSPGRSINRFCAAFSQIGFSILLIHLTGGRIETHFHVFGSLAFLAAYRDWRVIGVATFLTAVDHFVRGIYWPESVYGVLLSTPWRALEHSAWVAFEDSVLLLSMADSLKSMEALARNRVHLEENLEHVEDLVRERTAALEQSQRQVIDQQQALAATAKMSALGEMAGGVAHEINTPLATIRLLAENVADFASDARMEGLQGESRDASIVKMARKIESTTERLAKIVQGLRTFSRDGSRDPIQRIPLAVLFEDTFSFCRERFHSMGVMLKADEVPADRMISCRPTQMSQVLLNLLNNALDAVEGSSEKWVRVGWRVDGDDLCVEVEDSGPGIPAEVREKIFQPFFTTKAIGKGTGLGLSVSLGIVQSHEGTMSLDMGSITTKFIIRLHRNATFVGTSSASSSSKASEAFFIKNKISE